MYYHDHQFDVIFVFLNTTKNNNAYRHMRNTFAVHFFNYISIIPLTVGKCVCACTALYNAYSHCLTGVILVSEESFF